MKIENKKVVELTYELTVDGKVVYRTTEMTGPLDYIHGEHMLLPKFEAELEGLEPESEFAFTLTPEEGYGEYDPKHKFEIPKQSFEIDGKIREDLMQVGKIIPMLNSSGMVVQGLIAAVNDDTVTMDFNHPMAGKTLNFKGKVISVRDATEKELTEGLHGEFAPKEGGCHGGMTTAVFMRTATTSAAMARAMRADAATATDMKESATATVRVTTDMRANATAMVKDMKESAIATKTRLVK